MPRRILEPGPIAFGELRLDNQTSEELKLTRQVIEKNAGPPDTLDFTLISAPTIQLVESVIIESIARKRLTPEMFDYGAWRRSGAPEPPLRELFAYIDWARRQIPEFSAHKTRVEELEALYAAGAQVDPLIARSFDHLPLSSGDETVFILDGRHRLFAAASQGVDELDVYVTAIPEQSSARSAGDGVTVGQDERHHLGGTACRGRLIDHGRHRLFRHDQGCSRTDSPRAPAAAR